MEIKESTGRATCKKCYKVIQKGGYQVLEDTVDNWNHPATYRYHASCYIEVLEDNVKRAIVTLKRTKRQLASLYAKQGKTPWSK